MNPSLILIACANFIWGLGESTFIYFQAIYLSQLGADPLMIGSILGAMGVMMILSHIPAGHLADRVGRRPLILAGWITGVISASIMALARSLPVFVVGLLLYGSTAFVTSPLYSYATAARGKWSISRTLSLISASYAFGSVLGPITGGWIGNHFGLRLVFGVAACIFVVSTIVLSFIRPQPRDHHDPEEPPVQLLRNGRYLVFIAIVFAIIFAQYLPQPLTPNFLQQTRGLNLAQIGLLGTIAILGNALFTMAFGAWLKPLAGILLGQFLTISFALLIWQVQVLPFYALAYFLLGGFRASRPLMAARARELVHPSQMGLAFGMGETVAAIAFTLAPIAAGLLYQRAPDLMYPAAIGLIVLSILLTIWLVPRPGGEHA